MSDFYPFLSVSLCFPSFLKHTHLFNKKQFNITLGEKKAQRHLGSLSTCASCRESSLALPDGVTAVASRDPDSSGSPGGQEGLRSLRAYLPSQTCVLAPQPPPCPPHTHCRRSCRPSFHTSGLFSRVTDSTGPLETGGWREGRWAVLVRAPPCTHHLLHHPWSPFLRESEASLCPCAPPL